MMRKKLEALLRSLRAKEGAANRMAGKMLRGEAWEAYKFSLGEAAGYRRAADKLAEILKS